MKTWFKMLKAESGAEISVYDEIGGWGITAKDFRRELIALGDVGEITLRINSPGGDVIDGFAIYNMLLEHPAKITAKIDGWAASMASIIAMAADEIEMPSNTWMMIHKPWTVAVGESGDLLRMADILSQMEVHAVNAYMRHVNLEEDEVKALLEAGTWMDGKDAVEKGFAQVLTDELEIAASVKTSLKDVPAGAQVWLLAEDTGEEKEDPAPESEPETDVSPVEEEAPESEENNEEKSENVSEQPEEDDAETCSETVENENPADIVYDEGFAAGYAKAQREATEAVESELKQAQDTIVKLNDDFCAAIKERDDMQARLSRMTAGLRIKPNENKESFESFGKARDKLGYADARMKYPELFEEYRQKQREKNRR